MSIILKSEVKIWPEPSIFIQNKLLNAIFHLRISINFQNETDSDNSDRKVKTVFAVLVTAVASFVIPQISER